MIINIFLFLIGVIIIANQFVISNNKCPPEKVIYKYVPRTFKQEQTDPIQASEIFKDLFEKPNLDIQR